MIDPKDALTEQELENLVALDASAQTEAAGGGVTVATAVGGLVVAAAGVAGVSSACTDTCSSWVKNL